MTPSLARLLSAVLPAVALAATASIAIELGTAAPDFRSDPTPGRRQAERPTIRPDAAGGKVASVTISGWAGTVLARPVFNASRRPAAVAGAGPSVLGLPRMSGTVVTPSGRRAIFVGERGGPIVVEEGGHLGAFTVTAIRAGEVVLTGPDGSRTLGPVFDRKMPTPAPVASGYGGLPGLPGLQGLNLGGLPGVGSPSPPATAPR